MAPSSPQSNSLLNLLNPYATSSRSPFAGNQPDSPSTMLLRELQGDEEEDGQHGGDSNSASEKRRREELDLRARERERMSSPTPTPLRPRPTMPTHILATPSTSSDDEDENQPPSSMLYPEREKDRTPRSPPSVLAQQPIHRSIASPGPFRTEPHAGPSSSSASASEGRSRSTSPGPSTISNYASGIDLDGTTALGAAAGSTSASRDLSTSPGTIASSPPLPLSRQTPTFRESPVRPRPPSLNRAVSTSSSSKKHSEPGGSRYAPKGGQGYLDPDLSSPRKGKSKGKGKTRSLGGRKYHGLDNANNEDEDDNDDGLGEGASSRSSRGGRSHRKSRSLSKSGLSQYERALWQWVNVDDLDGYLQEVYAYYKGKGLYCIALARVLNLLTTFFVIGFSTFLLSCIDYPKLWATSSHPGDIERLDDVLIPQCITRGSVPHMLFILAVTAVYIFQLVSFALSLPRLWGMHQFYTHLLGVPDVDIQTLPWPEIVRLIGEIRKHNPITSLSNGQAGALADMVGEDANTSNVKKLDAHDVANRILRQENYLIALFNKDLLDLRVRLPIPPSIFPYIPSSLLAPITSSSLPGTVTHPSSEKRFLSFGANTLTKALEWNLRFCLMGYLFDRRGQVRREFVKERRRKDLVEGLRRRFIFMGILNAIFAPFIVIYLLVYSFFRYFEEYHKNPSSVVSRQYTLYAQWKFREFNELPHLFERRLDRSYPTAKEYIDQFPKERTALVMRFVAFIAGSFAAVLLVASLIDPDLFLHFEITPHRSVLFYLGVFGSILAIARGMVPEENLVFDPEASLREVVKWTHYLPGEWKGKLHSQMVHEQFGNLFQPKIMIFAQELLSVLLTPFILFFSLPPCTGAIIDFFREFTVHVEGMGYVCSFAVFDFRLHGHGVTGDTGGGEDKTNANGHITATATATAGTRQGRPRHIADNGYGFGRANENKMEKSFLHFKATHPDWQPDPSSSIFLDKLVGMHARETQGQGSPASPFLSTSIYGGGGRGLGIGEERERQAERSRSYDRAWAKSSHLLRNRNQPSGAQGYQDGPGARSKLETMREDEVENEHEAEDLGWNSNPRAQESEGSEDEDEERRGWLGDAGMVGLLQQVLSR